MDEKLILNDETELTGHAIEFNNQLFLYIHEMGMADVFQELINPEKVKKITGITGEIKAVFRGYKKLTAIRDEGNGLISAVLLKA